MAAREDALTTNIQSLVTGHSTKTPISYPIDLDETCTLMG